MERYFSIIAIATMALGAAWTANAAEQPGMSAPPAFEELDADGSGTISLDEATGHPSLQRIFARVDANRDGQLAKDEYAAAQKELKSEGSGG